jgi:hypothetical protein
MIVRVVGAPLIFTQEEFATDAGIAIGTYWGMATRGA